LFPELGRVYLQAGSLRAKE